MGSMVGMVIFVNRVDMAGGVRMVEMDRMVILPTPPLLLKRGGRRVRKLEWLEWLYNGLKNRWEVKPGYWRESISLPTILWHLKPPVRHSDPGIPGTS